jgi:FkbM family methyltransferase
MSLAEFLYTVVLKPAPLRFVANATLKRCIPKVLNVQGAKIRSNPDDPVVSGALTFGVYENDEIAFFIERIRKGATFVDVGANIGLYTGLALSRGAAKVVSFEPHRESRGILAETIHLNVNPDQSVQVFPCAISDRKGSFKLYTNPDNKGDNRLYPNDLCKDAEDVETDTLDAVCKMQGISTIDFLKIDTQGSEAKAIAGATGILTRSDNVVLMTEFWPYGLEKCGSNPMSYLAQIEALGFRMFELEKGTLKPFIPEEVIRKTSGRKYTNLIGLKGQAAL